MGDAQLDGRNNVTIVGMQTVTGDVVPPVLAGRLPDAPGEIALGGRELRALRKRVGDTITARAARTGQSRCASPARWCCRRRSPTSRPSSAAAR